MDGINTTGLSFDIDAAVLPADGKIPGWLGRSCLALMFFISAAGFVWHSLELGGFFDGMPAPTLLPASAGIALCLCLSALPEGKKPRLGYYAVVIFLAVFIFIARAHIADGMNVAGNYIFEVLERRNGRIFPRYGVSADADEYALRPALFFLAPSVPLAMISSKLACGGKIWRYSAVPFVAALLAGVLAFNFRPAGVWFGFMAFSLFGVVSRHAMLRNKLADDGKALLPVFLTLSAAVILSALPALPLAAGGAAADAGAGIKNELSERIHKIRYERTPTAMPEGDFRNLRGFFPGDGLALELRMNKPQPMYLRGYVGEKYTGQGWAALGNDTLAGYADLFSWLHGEGFYGQRQFSELAFTVDADAQNESVRIDVRNFGACGSYIYAPYGLTAPGSGAGQQAYPESGPAFFSAAPDPLNIGDKNIISDGFFGRREYSFATIYQTERQNRLYNLLYEARNGGGEGAGEYLSREVSYRQFVYDNYLEIPDTAARAISVLPGLPAPPREGRAGFTDIRDAISAWLLGNISYNEETDPPGDGQDFFRYFMEVSKSGYSVHYATAAALLFRYYGVPARYVEGYYIPYDDVRGLPGGSAIAVYESRARAWAEVYRDGVGFVPYEAAPPDIRAADGSGAGSGNDGGNGGAGDPDIPDEPEPPPENDILKLILRIFAILLIFLAAAASAALLALRRMSTRRRERIFNDPDNSEAVCGMLSYAMILIGHLGVCYKNGSLLSVAPDLGRKLGPDQAEKFAGAVAVQREAMFGKKAVSDEKRLAVRVFTLGLLTALKKDKKWTQRLRLRWIFRVY